MEAGPGEAAPGEHGGAPRRRQRAWRRSTSGCPAARTSLGRRAVAQHQRVRIHGAMVQAVAADGYDAVSVRQVIALAGVSRRSFYEQFASKQECFLATFDVIVRRQLAASRAACAQAGGGAGGAARGGARRLRRSRRGRPRRRVAGALRGARARRPGDAAGCAPRPRRANGRSGASLAGSGADRLAARARP